MREVLATSEKERLNERKEKLSALQNMIKLTKTKSDIEEELDERKKADTKESSEKVCLHFASILTSCKHIPRTCI